MGANAHLAAAQVLASLGEYKTGHWRFFVVTASVVHNGVKATKVTTTNHMIPAFGLDLAIQAERNIY